MRTKSLVLLLGILAACGAPQAGRQKERTAPMGGMGTAADTQAMTSMAGVSGEEVPIRITLRQAALAGATYAVAQTAPVHRTVRAVAMAVSSERALGIVSARVSGWVETLYANETGRVVEVGEPLLELYAPELVTAQEELLLAQRLGTTVGGDSLIAAARRRLALWGIAQEEIASIERTGQVRRDLTIRSRYRGHILEKNVIEGQNVQAGDVLFRVADLSTIWIEPAIFENDIPLLRVGQRAQATFDAIPGKLLDGRITFIYPELDMGTRTLRVRVEMPNEQLLVKPKMFGSVQIAVDGPRGVTVPLGAILPTGTRNLAFVVRQGGIVPTEITVGTWGDTAALVASGLAPGDTVVASAAFLFDSESQLGAAMAGIMLNMGMGLDMGGMGTKGMDMPGMGTPPTRPGSMPGMRDSGMRSPEGRP